MRWSFRLPLLRDVLTACVPIRHVRSFPPATVAPVGARRRGSLVHCWFDTLGSVGSVLFCLHQPWPCSLVFRFQLFSVLLLRGRFVSCCCIVLFALSEFRCSHGPVPCLVCWEPLCRFCRFFRFSLAFSFFFGRCDARPSPCLRSLSWGGVLRRSGRAAVARCACLGWSGIWAMRSRFGALPAGSGMRAAACFFFHPIFLWVRRSLVGDSRSRSRWCGRFLTSAVVMFLARRFVMIVAGFA